MRLLFATDIAARGLDVADVDLVVNYDFPVQRGEGGVEEYVHRIGVSSSFFFFFFLRLSFSFFLT